MLITASMSALFGKHGLAAPAVYSGKIAFLRNLVPVMMCHSIAQKIVRYLEMLIKSLLQLSSLCIYL